MKAIKALVCGLLVVISMVSVGCSSISGGAQALITTQGDLDLINQVQYRLRVDPITDRTGIGVRAHNGSVTLVGSIPNEQIRARAIGIAKATEGVTDVVDKMEVSYSSPLPRLPTRSP